MHVYLGNKCYTCIFHCLVDGRWQCYSWLFINTLKSVALSFKEKRIRRGFRHVLIKVPGNLKLKCQLTFGMTWAWEVPVTEGFVTTTHRVHRQESTPMLW